MGKIFIFAIAVFSAFSISGCGSAQVKKDAMDAVKYAGILSVVVEKVAPGNPGNMEVIQKTADYAYSQLENQLKNVKSFKIVPVARYYANPDFQNAGTMGKSAGVQAYLKKMAADDPNFALSAGMAGAHTKTQALQALFGGMTNGGDTGKAIETVNNAAQARLEDTRRELTGTKGLPFIPYGVLTADNQNGAQIKMGDSANKKDYFKEMLFADVADLCKKLKLDAMIVAYVSVESKDVGGVRVITGGNRVLGTVRLNMTMMLIDKNGEIIADLGWPSMDDLAPGRLLMPAHIVTSWDGRLVKTMAADLDDPDGTVLKGLKELVVESSGKMTADFRKAIGEIKE